VKIAFWSSMHGQANTTSSMLSVVLTLSALYEKKILVTQSHYNLNNLEIPLIGKIQDKEFYRDTGLDALIRISKSRKLTKEMVHNCCISVIRERLDLLLGTRQSNRNIFEIDINKFMSMVIRQCEEFYDLIFIDTNSGGNETSLSILRDADAVVVCLNQSETMLDDFFNNYHKSVVDDAFYLFGAYDGESKFNINNIKRRHKYVNNGNSGVIPYNIEFSDSLADGNMRKYFRYNLDSDSDAASDGFFREVRESTYKLMKYISVRGGRRISSKS